MISNGALLLHLHSIHHRNSMLFLMILITNSSNSNWTTLPWANLFLPFPPLALGEDSAMLESNMSAPWVSIKTRAAFSRLPLGGFCLFWRINALNSGVLGVEPLRSFFGYVILIPLVILLCLMPTIF